MGDTKISHEQTIAFANKAAETVEKILISYLKNQ
jgi:purine-nucleoside phosphorylase